MATVTKPIALDESFNTTELTPRNTADVLAQELANIASAITGGSDKVPKTDIATVEPTNTASRAYSVGELVYVNGNLYKVITAISIGSTFTVGTNIKATKVGNAVRNVEKAIGNTNLSMAYADSISITDVNDCPPGFCSSNFTTNTPSGNQESLCVLSLAMNGDMGYCKQIAWSMSDSTKLYIRQSFGGSWGAWKQLIIQ